MGCLKSIVGLILALIVGVLIFLNRDKVSDAIDRLRGRETVVATEPSQELADAALEKLSRLESGEARQIALNEVELQSLLLFKYRELLPAFLDSPAVKLRGDQIQVEARVPLDRLPQVSEIGDAANFLPDTTQVTVKGKLLPLRSGRVALAVDGVSAAGVPLPRRLVAGALKRLGREEEAGLPADAMAVPLPPGVASAYVRGDSLIFLAKEQASPDR